MPISLQVFRLFHLAAIFYLPLLLLHLFHSFPSYPVGVWIRILPSRISAPDSCLPFFRRFRLAAPRHSKSAVTSDDADDASQATSRGDERARWSTAVDEGELWRRIPGQRGTERRSGIEMLPAAAADAGEMIVPMMSRALELGLPET